MKRSCFVLIGTLLLSIVCQSRGQTSRVGWFSLSGGFGQPSSANDLTTSMLGQPFIDATNEGNTFVTSGFLADSLLRGPMTSAPNQQAIPSIFALEQNYPNPFNPTTTIRFEIPERTYVTLRVFNLLGQEVANLVNEEKAPGAHNVKFDAAALSSGAYFYVLRAGSAVQTRKLIVLK